MIPTPQGLALGLLALVAGPNGQDGAAPWEPLDYEVITRWEWELPDEVWRPLGASLTVGGVTFAFTPNDRVLEIDADGNGRMDTRVRKDEGLVTLRAKALGGTYAVRVRREGDAWSWAPGGMLTGRIEGVKVRLLDLDGDGRHGTHGVDALIVGRLRHAGFMTEVAAIDGALVHLEVEEDGDGARMRTHAYQGPVAHLDARSGFESSGALECAIFRSGNVYIDAASTKKPLLVPCGTYELVLGRVTRGARQARIAPGRFMPIELAEGAHHEITWGGRLHADFTYHVLRDELTVNPDVHFFDEAGAEYLGFAPIAKAPLLRVRNAETGNLVQFGRFGGCCGGGYTAWRATVPQGLDLVVELEHERMLFGKIAGTGRPEQRR
jgi:hypothetical protein